MTKQHDEWWMTKAQYLDLTDKNLKLQACLDQIIPEIEPALHVGSSILDFGCGIGRLAIPVAKHFTDANVIGCDISQTFLEDAIAEANLQGVADRCYFMGFLDENISLDAAYTMLVLQHLPNDRKRQYIQQIANALNPFGVFRFQYVEGDSDTFLTHDAKFDDVSQWLTDAGLEIASVDYNLIEPRWTWVTAVKELKQ